MPLQSSEQYSILDANEATLENVLIAVLSSPLRNGSNIRTVALVGLSRQLSLKLRNFTEELVLSKDCISLTVSRFLYKTTSCSSKWLVKNYT